jgi:WD40 repeat protein/tetratricopeptide (TPR) repeat protein
MMKTVSSQLANPFPGLRPFRSDEHHLFFGREEQTAALLQLLRTNRFLAVVGTSGSGKSSLVRAGMIAELHGGTMTHAGSTWEVMILRPGGSPIENLARAFVEADLYDPEDPSTLPRLLATLNRSRFGLVEAMKQSELFEPGTNLLVVVDQFEELFRFRQQGVDSEETAAAFVSLLLTASAQAERPIYVTITMRSDYLGDCSEIPGLAEAVNEGEYLIPRLLRDQKRDAIEKPIGVGGAKISPLLVQRLLNAVGDDPDQLPVMQHALMRMWDVWSAGSDHDRPIDFGDFEATGGLGAALSNHADEIYDSLPDDRHRSACEKIFKTLTVKGEDNRGIRRPTRLAHLQAIANSDKGTVTTVLDAFRGAGVTFVMPGTEVELRDRTVLDLSHESLMRGWQRLRGWVEEEAQSARVFRRLLDTARLWSDGKAGLFRDPDLQIALSWREQEVPNSEWADQYGGHFDTAIGFLETSSADAKAERQAKEVARQRELEQARELAESRKQRLMQQQRATRRLRKLLAGLGVVAVIAGLACVVALVSQNEASRLAEVAELEADNARQNEERAKKSQQETKSALADVETEKAKVEGSLAKTKAAERLARDAEEEGRKLLYTTDMRLAPFVWKDDRITAEQLRVLLAKHIPDSKTAGNKDGHAAALKPDLRGFEWHYYQHLLEQSAPAFSGHTASVSGGAITSDSQLVTLDQNGQVRRWYLTSQAEDKAGRRDLPGGANAQVRVLSPNGRLAAFAEGNKVHVFDTATGQETHMIDSAQATNRHLIFSRDSAKLVIVDDKIRWLSAAMGEVIASVNQRFQRVESLALTADGLTLAVVGHGYRGHQVSIFRLDAKSKKVTPLAKDFGLGGTLNTSALTPDGQRIAVSAKLNGSLYVFDTATGRTIASHGSAHASAIAAMAFSGDGAKLATADAEGTIKIWADAQKLTSKSAALLTLKGHQGAITSLGFSSAGKRLVSTSADKTARVWDLENAGAAIRPVERSASWVARFSPDGQLIAASGWGVQLWDAATGRLVRELSAGDNKGFISSVAFSPTDNRLLAVGYGGQQDVSYVALWDIDAGTELARLPGAVDPTKPPGSQADQDDGLVGALAFSPDGKYLVAGFGSKNLFKGQASPNPLKVWEVSTRRLIRRLNGHTDYCLALDFSRDGKLLASGSRDGLAILWSTTTWNKAHTLENPDPASLYSSSGRSQVEAVAFSPDGKTLAVASFSGSLHLWDVAGGKLRETLKGHSSAAQAVAFSPDGRTLASGSIDQTVRLWNVETGRQLMQLDPGNVEVGQVQTLSFSPDGKQLLAGGSHGTAFWSTAPIVWNDPDQAAEKLRLLLRSNADFKSRIRMLSEHLRLHEALAKLDTKDVRVRAALAATQANWHASHQAWPEAAKAFDRLAAADPTAPEAWLRTPGLLRLATALLHQDRPAAAALLLQGGAKLRSQDPASSRVTGVGMKSEMEGGALRLKELVPGSPAARSKLLTGDVIVKVDGVEVTNVPDFLKMLQGKVGTKHRLTVRHPGKTETEDVDLVTENFRVDAATAELFSPLLAALEKRLAKNPRDAGLLELRAELAGDESDFARQVADYSAAIKMLSEQPAKTGAAHLQRLYRRRGDVYISQQKWPQAVADYAHVITAATTDESLLSNQALAQAHVILEREARARWTVLEPTELKSKGGATLTKLGDDSILASGINPDRDVYTIIARPALKHITAIRLEALPDPSLPHNGPGRCDNGNFNLNAVRVFSGGRPSTLTDIIVSFDANSRLFRDVIAGSINASVGWGILPRTGERHTAIIATRLQRAPDDDLKIELYSSQKQWNTNNLGRFRLSVSGDPAALDREQKHFAATDPWKFTNPWQKLAAAYQLKGDQRAIDQLVERRPKLAGLIGDLFIQGKDEDKSLRRALALYTKGITAATPDAELLSKRARAYEALKKWDAAAADWSRAATGNPGGPRLLADFARRLASGGQAPLAKAQLDKSQALYQQMLKADPENDLVASELAQLLLNRTDNESSGRWAVLKPVEAKSELGATLSILPDQSILASGTNPQNDRYRVVVTVGADIDLVAVRLDALTHASLPGNGPGRYVGRSAASNSAPEPGNFYRGTFAQQSWNVTATSPNGKERITLAFDNASDDPGVFYPITSKGHWNIAGGGEGRNCAAIWSLAKPVPLAAGTTLTFEMQFGGVGAENLGHFRLSVTGDRASFEGKQGRFVAMKVTEPWSKLAAAYALNLRNDEASQYFGRALKQADGYQARKPIVELAARFDDVLSGLIQRQPDDPQLQLASARKLAERGKRRLAEKQPAKAQSELEKSRAILTRFPAEPKWTVLTPTEIKSKAGTTLTLQSDGSILASGANPRQETFTIVAKPALAGITAVRLETLPDPSLPKGGSGRDPNGSFLLSEFTVSRTQPGAPPGHDSLPLRIRGAVASFHRTMESGAQYPIQLAIDGQLTTAWDTWPEILRRQQAVFELAPKLENTTTSSLVVQLTSFGWAAEGSMPGRFRLSVTSEADPLTRAALHMDLKDGEVVDVSVALANAHAQQGHIDKAVASFTEALDLAKDRAAKAKIIAEAAPLAGVLDKLAEHAPGDAQLQAELARHYAERGKAALAEAARAKARTLFQEKLAKEPENADWAAELAEVLLIDTGSKWTILKPTEIKSQGGATLTLLDDGSILASGASREKDVYVIQAKFQGRIESIRLEAIPHPSLPHGSSGRRLSDGNFALTEFKIEQATDGRQGAFTPVRLRSATCDYSQPHSPISNALDGRDDTFWDILPHIHQPHYAVFKPERPLAPPAGLLRLTLEFKYPGDTLALGRFRLSISSASAVYDQEEQRFAALKLADPWAKLAAAYAVNLRNDEAAQYFSRALKQADGYEARKSIVELAARFGDLLSVLAQRQPDDAQLHLALARKLAERGMQRLADKQLAEAQAELEKARVIFTRLRAESPWTVLTPTEMKSQGGETLTVERDGSIFVSGPNPSRAVYPLKLRTELPALRAIRLETIPDARLPNGGAGRFGNGNFHVAEFTAAIVSDRADVKPVPIEFGSAVADASQDPQNDATKIIDGNPRTYWDTHPRMKEPHWAVFVLKSPARVDGCSLSITLDSGIAHWNQHGLGRFRLSATNAADLKRAIVRTDLKDSEVADLCIALAKAHAQQGDIKDAVASFTEAVDLAADRAARAKIIAEAAPLKGVLEKLAERAASNAQFQAELARHYAEQGNVPLAEAARAKARALFEQKLAKEPNNTDLAAETADLLLIDSRAGWAVLKPAEMKSAGGATLTLLEDGSILSSGKHPERDDYTVICPTGMKNIGAIALDVLPHDSLGGAGGRGVDGESIITQLEVSSRDRSGHQQPVPLTDAAADFEQPDWPGYVGRNAINGKDDSPGWGVRPHWKTPHRLVVKPGQPIAAGTSGLTFVIRQHHFNKDHKLGLLVGRFRLSVSADPQAFEHERNRLAALKLTDPFTRLAAAYHVIGDLAARDRLLARHPAATAGIGDLYALAQDWKRALAEYTRAIANGSKDARTFAARADAYEKLEKWELAAADWASADASDKTFRFGTPPWLVLERRAQIHGRLQQWDKQVQDYTELLKPERFGNSPWILNGRGDAYDHLRQWDKALADFDQALKVCSPEERGVFHSSRARHFAGRGQWKQAALDMQQVYKEPADFNSETWWRGEWWRLRDAALIFGVAGDVDNYGKAATACYRKQTGTAPNADESHWTVLTMVLFPEMITNENRTRLLELAGKTDAYWRPRLTAAIHFRGGDYKKAAELFDANRDGPQFMFLAAMAQQNLGKHDRARKLLEDGNAWVSEQRAKDPKAGVPQGEGWHYWATVITLQYEASDLIFGPNVNKLPERAVGAANFQAALARHLAERGNAAAAKAARAKARALFERRLAAKPDDAALASELADWLWSALPPAEYIWIDDAPPPGASLQGDTPWEFVRGPEHPVFRGRKSTRRQAKGVMSQHFFDGAAPGLRIGEGARLFAYVYLDPKDPPKAVMLQFKDGTSWEHRAFWGEDVIPFGAGGKENHLAMGPLPRAGEWARLEVEATRVGLSPGTVLDGWAFTQHGGTCYWDAAGYTRSFETPWQKLAAAYHRLGDQQALATLVKQHPEAAWGVGDLYAASQNWERAIAEYRKLITDERADVALLTRLATAYQVTGRTREAIPNLAKASAANPKDTILALEVAARQAWFDQETEFAATRRRILAFAKGTNSEFTANQAAKACSIRASIDKAELEAALAIGRKGVELGKRGQFQEWNLLALGMAEYRSGNYAAAEEALLAAAKAGSNNSHLMGTAAFCRAMSLFRQGKKDEARKLAIVAAAKMKPLPKDDNNPLAAGGDHNDLILWLAYKEAAALLKIRLSPIELLEEARKDEVETLGADHPTTVATTNKLIDAYQTGGRTRDAVPLLVIVSSADPKDTLLALKVAALQAWLGQDKEFAATRQRMLAFAKGTNDLGAADHTAKGCSIRASTDKAELEAAVALGRKAVELGKGGQWEDWDLLALGMAEYRWANYVAAEEALRAAPKAGSNNPTATGIAAFYRAMILFRRGKHDEARKVAIAAAARMKPLPKDEQNPLADGAYYDHLILWLAYKEAKAMIKFDAAPAANWLMRALAHHRLGETDQAKKACRKAAEMMKLAGADPADRPLLRQIVRALGAESLEAREIIAAAAGALPARLNEAIQKNPDQANGYRDRAEWYGEHGRWKEAIADYAEVGRLDPKTLDAMRLSFLLAWTGAKDSYRKHGQAMLSRWASTEKNDEADQTLKAIVLIPGYKADARQLARLAAAAVAGDPARDWYEWWQIAKALHDLRTGRYADALTACRASRRRAPETNGDPQVLTALSLAIEALALHGAGKADEARRTLEQAKPLVESQIPGIDGDDWWADWLSVHMLYREAVGLILTKKPGPKKESAAGSPSPKKPAK